MSASPRLSCIWAISENGVIGRDGALPWRLPADLRRFRRLTTGHAIVMGRRTWESIGRPLPERRSIVLSRDPSFRAPGAEVVRSLDEALELARDDSDVFVIGGATVYRIAVPRADRLHVTLVHAQIDGDVKLPSDVLDGFRLVADERHEGEGKNEHAYSFRVYETTRNAVLAPRE